MYICWLRLARVLVEDVYMCIHMYTHVGIYVYIYIYIHIYLHTHTHTHVFVFLCIYVYVYMYVCIYIYIYIHACIYTLFSPFVYIIFRWRVLVEDVALEHLGGEDGGHLGFDR